MSFYAIGDIHGCYDEFQDMLKLINFNLGDDCLILLGDYIDRGNQSYDMIQWLIKNKSRWIVMLRGNHEQEYMANIDILNSINNIENMDLYDVCKQLHDKSEYFDLYGTIRQLIKENNASLYDLNVYYSLFNSMHYYYRRKIGPKYYHFVHAGYPYDNLDIDDKKEFMLYAREEAYTTGGVRNDTIICGHTPTIAKEEFVYNKGNVFEYYNEQINCRYFNIDCGCVFKPIDNDAKLACIRLEDEKIFYV